MEKGIHLSNNSTVLSYKYYGFEEVLNDFKNAEYINIVTYNISTKSKELLHKLAICNNIPVNIITNIPGRMEDYSKYYGVLLQNILKSAERDIHSYCDTLKRESYANVDLTVHFNFHNHAKIIMTNNLAYIGSANFSDASMQNFEMGCIVRDKNLIRELHTKVIPHLQTNGVRYATSYLGVTKEYFRTILSETVERLRESLFTVMEVGYCRDEVVFDTVDASIAYSVWEKFTDIKSYVDNWYEELTQDITLSNKDQSSIKSALDKVTSLCGQLDASLKVLASHGRQEQNRTMELFFDYDTGDNLDEAMQRAQQEVAEEKWDILEKINSNQVTIFMDSLSESIQNFMNQLDGIPELRSESIYENREKIVNTPKRSK